MSNDDLHRGHLLLIVARNAALNLENLPPDERIELLRGLALILPEDQAEEARHTAFAIRRTEEQQLKFRELLKS